MADYNKVDFNGETLINLTDTTATENDVLKGKKFHDKSGALRDGNLVIPTYTAGAGIDITNGEISAKVDGTTIKTNASGQLEVDTNVIARKEGDWELIDTITVSDSGISQIRKNVDGNGDAIALKNIAFYIYLPSDSRESASTFEGQICNNNAYTNWCGRIYRQSIVGRTLTGVYWENKIENGYWNNKYEIYQGINSLLAKTYLSESATDSSILNRRAETSSPYCRSYTIKTGGDPFPIGTTIKVYAIK